MTSCEHATTRVISCSEYRPKVLIAQSDYDDSDILMDKCRLYNKFDVDVAYNGQQVIDKVNESCYDAILLGLKFPDITGATLAYLIHQFDPLVSVAFLTGYSNDILIAIAKDLGFQFWNRDEKFCDLDKFCDEIYELAMEMPCDDEKRTIRREYMRPEREKYLRYGKLSVPKSLEQVLKEREEKEVAI